MSRDLVRMAVSLFTWGIGEGMFLYFQPIYLENWGANPVQIGLILSLMGVAMAVAQAPAGYLADRVGSRPVMWSSWVLGTIAAAMMALAGSLSAFVAGMLVYGLTSFVVAPMNSYITSVRGRWSVARALTVVSAMFHLGAVIGPIAGGIIAEAVGLHNVYRISAVIFLISTIMVLQCRRPPAEELPETLAKRPNLVRNPRFAGLLALVLLTMTALYLPQPLTPAFLNNEQGLSLQVIGQLGAMGSLGNALIMLGLGHLSAPVGLLAGQALVGLFALMMWRSESTLLYFAGYFFVGGYRLCRSMVLAYARTLVKPNETGFAFGLVETGNAFAVILAPMAAGFLYNANPHSVYIASLAAIGLSLLITFTRLPRGSELAAAAAAQPSAQTIEQQEV